MCWKNIQRSLFGLLLVSFMGNIISQCSMTMNITEQMEKIYNALMERKMGDRLTSGMVQRRQ